METSNILIVDDELSVIKALTRSFLDDPYKVYSAISATEGLSILAKVEIKVVISDEGMPGMSGADFLAKVKRSLPAVVPPHAPALSASDRTSSRPPSSPAPPVGPLL